MDARSGSICLSLVERRRHSHSNTYRDTNCDSYSYGNSDSNGDRYSNSNAWSQVHSQPEATSYPAPAAIAHN